MTLNKGELFSPGVGDGIRILSCRKHSQQIFFLGDMNGVSAEIMSAHVTSNTYDVAIQGAWIANTFEVIRSQGKVHNSQSRDSNKSTTP